LITGNELVIKRKRGAAQFHNDSSKIDTILN
jgi:hypothetical protein